MMSNENSRSGIAQFTVAERIDVGQHVVVDSNRVAHPVGPGANGISGIVIGHIVTNADGSMTVLVRLYP